MDIEGILRMKQNAIVKINSLGSSFVHLKTTEDNYVPGTGHVLGVTTRTNLKGLFLQYETSEIGNIIQVGDIKLLINSNDGDKITVKDKIMYGDVSYEVKNITPQIVKDVVIYYYLQIRT